MTSKHKTLVMTTIIIFFIILFTLISLYFYNSDNIVNNGTQYYEFGIFQQYLLSVIGLVVLMVSIFIIYSFSRLFSNLKQNEAEAGNLKIYENIREWKSEGLNSIVRILSDKSENINELSNKIITFLVTYVKAAQGALFISVNSENSKSLQLIAGYGINLNNAEKQNINFGDGLIGTCAIEKKVIYLENITDSYFEISSFLGKAQPACLLIIPLLIEDKIYGVIEIGAFQKFDNYIKEFITDVSENISNTLFKLEVATETAKLLEKTKLQARELKNKEEILKQNIEELNSVQENILKQKELIQQSEQQIKSILNSSPELILSLNKNGTIKSVSNHCKLLLGYEDFELVNKPVTKIMRLIKINKILNGDRKRQKVFRKDETTFMVELNVGEIDTDNNEKDFLFFLKDITNDIKKEQELIISLELTQAQKQETKTKNDELVATEEELRQTMEEMQAIQDALLQQKTFLAKSEQQIKSILNSSPELILVLSKNGTIKSVSNHCFSLLGYDDFELVNKPVIKIMRLIKIDKILNGDRKRQKVFRKDESTFMVELNVGEIDTDTNEKDFLFFLKDITNDIKREQELIISLELTEIQKQETKEKNIELNLQKEEVAKQRDALKKLYSDIQILSEIGKEITAILNIEQIVNTVYNHVNQLMDATVFTIGIYQPSKNGIWVYSKEENKSNVPFFYDLSDKNRLAVICFEQKHEIFISDMDVEYIRYMKERKKPLSGNYVSSIIYLPLIRNNESIGTISIQSYNKNAYTENNLNLLRNIAIYTSIAIENGNIFAEIEIQKNLLTKQNINIIDSINYAKRIQKAIIPKPEILNNVFSENFVYLEPRDIVSGDFYWFRSFDDFNAIVAADCTGHGVPGAFMSILGISILNEIVNRNNVNSPAQILFDMRIYIKKMLQQTGEIGEQQDGMDIAFCSLNSKTNILYYAGAHNPLWIIRNNQSLSEKTDDINLIEEIKSDRMPIGVHPNDDKQFTNHQIEMKKGDVFYIFSDGFESQFGGEKGDKIKTKRFQELLLSLNKKKMQEQKLFLQEKFTDWKGTHEQTDDVLVIGVKI